MTQKELIAKIAETNDMTKKDTKEMIDMVVTAICDNLSSGESVKLNAIGTFVIADRAAREGRNPATGEKILIPASKFVKFKPCKALKEAVKKL